MTSFTDMAIAILQKTHDGDDLAPEHLKLLEIAVNGELNEEVEIALNALYENVEAGYTRSWFHGIKHLTIDHEGFVYWKDHRVEYYNMPWAYSYEAKIEARELAQRCIVLERAMQWTGREVNTGNVVWLWEDIGEELGR